MIVADLVDFVVINLCLIAINMICATSDHSAAVRTDVRLQTSWDDTHAVEAKDRISVADDCSLAMLAFLSQGDARLERIVPLQRGHMRFRTSRTPSTL